MSTSTPAAARRRGGLRGRSAIVVLGAFALVVGGLASSSPGAVAAPAPASQGALHALAPTPANAAALADLPDLGPGTTVFDPSMPTAEIQAAVDAVRDEQVDAEMGTGRRALLFLPGTYGSAEQPLSIQVGYYTEVAGLGQNPGDVVINGTVNVYNRCLTADNCIALDNFWRSVSNLTINPLGGEGCRANTEFWAVSQAAPMRRVQVNGGLSFMDYCTAGPQYASGGFLADSRTADVVNGSQQQFLVRNSSIGHWTNGVWNQVFAGVEGAPAQSFPSSDPGPYTTLDTTPLSRERPYLYVDAEGSWNVFVPSSQESSSGPSWSDTTQTPGVAMPLTDFYLAHPGDTAQVINTQLKAGKQLLLTPGVYGVAKSVAVTHDRAVVLGLGYPTLTAMGGAVALDVSGAAPVIAGFMVDAGKASSPMLVHVGGSGGQPGYAASISDVFLRVGGPHGGQATLGMVVDAGNVVLDDLWIWRADHGTGVGWYKNTSATGLVVNGRGVIATGLFVEHFQKDNVIWNGDQGETIFFQNELPYDPPGQVAYRQGKTLGYAAYRVAPSVTQHVLWGAGSYVFFDKNPAVHASNAFQVPVAPGVQLHDLLTVNLGAGTIDHVVNGVGDPVTTDAVGTPSFVTSYP